MIINWIVYGELVDPRAGNRTNYLLDLYFTFSGPCGDPSAFRFIRCTIMVAGDTL